jgi:acetylornithine deacetylase
MKAGLAAYLVGIEALAAVGGRPEGDLLFSSVLEEECGGNGMLAVVQAGYEADATLIGEPTDLRLHANGVGILWGRLTARSGGAHAAFADPGDSPVDRILAAVQALRALEQELNRDREGHPYNLNLGEIHGGSWPSSVPAEVTLRFRLGYGPEVGPAEAQSLVAQTVAAGAPALELAFEGFRASAYEHELEGPLPDLLRSCHRELHGADPGTKVSTATTDARFVSGPCICYGPAAGNLHGIDEWVDLASVRDTAVAVALVASRWCGVSARP